MARTCSTSDVPIPKAIEPKAPWAEEMGKGNVGQNRALGYTETKVRAVHSLEVWESPQTQVVPGSYKEGRLG